MKSKSWKEKIWICGMFLLALAELCFGAVFPVYADDAHQHGKIQIDVIKDMKSGLKMWIFYSIMWQLGKTMTGC